MHVPIHDLKVRRTPIAQELGPWQVAMLPPDAEERNAVVDLCGPQQPPPGQRAPALLQLRKHGPIVARGEPEFPGYDAAGVPGRPIIGRFRSPKVPMPAETVYR